MRFLFSIYWLLSFAAAVSLQGCTTTPTDSAKSQYKDPPDPRLPKTKAERDFMTITTRAIYQVVPQEKERFELALADRRNPAFPALAKSNGITEISVKEVECERAAAYKIVGYANELGNILVAVCENGFRVRDLAIGARTVVDAVLKMPPNKEGESPKIEFYSQDTLENGSELYYLGSAAILFNKVTDRAVVVEVSTRMCNFSDWYSSSPLCTDIKGALKKITVAVEQSLGSR